MPLTPPLPSVPWLLFYAAGFLGLALACWRGLLSITDTLEHWTRHRRRDH